MTSHSHSASTSTCDTSMDSPSRRPATRPPNIYAPPSTQPVETSRFSPESPTLPRRPTTTTRSSLFSGRRSSSRTRDSTQQLPIAAQYAKYPGGTFHHHQTSTLSPVLSVDEKPKRESKLQKVWFDLRTMGHLKQQQPPLLPTARPLYLIEKEKNEPLPPTPAKTSRKQKLILVIVLIVLLLSLIGNVVLSIRLAIAGKPTIVVSSPSTSNTSSSTPSSSELTHDQQACVDQFTLNAVAAPASYPSSTCAGVLANVSLIDISNATLRSQLSNALDFSGLKGIYDAANAAGQTALFNQGWLVDTRICSWGNVECDSNTGRVISLNLVTPSVPQRLPNELIALNALQSFSLIGDTSLPGGSIPSSMSALTNLTTLHIEATGLASLPTSIFSDALKAVTSLTLVNNGNMNSIPDSVTSLSLHTLIVNAQPGPSPESILSSPTFQKSLQTLDLSRSPLSSLPDDFSPLSALTELHLANLTPASEDLVFPSALPLGSLTVLDLSGNGGLGGKLPGGMCSSGVLKTCRLFGTEFGTLAAGSCGLCVFA